MSTVLVTGGAGYVGSHACKVLASAGRRVVVYDNLSSGHHDFVRWGPLEKGDIRDTERLCAAMRKHDVESVMHFAALISVEESVAEPAHYFDNNLVGTLSVLKAMRDAGIGSIVLSSSCCVYGEPESVPIDEDTPQRPLNPYGSTKVMMEQLCRDFEAAHGIRSVALRYFNASGADAAFEIGEAHEPETHLIPRIFLSAEGTAARFRIYGTDYDTPDGTCVRDFIHVTDLGEAHFAALTYLEQGGGSDAFNVGTGQGHSVKEVLALARDVTSLPIPAEVAPPRPGDSPCLIAASDKARRVLGWGPQHSDLRHIVETAWGWHRNQRRRSVGGPG